VISQPPGGQVRFGLVGAGRIAQTYVEAFGRCQRSSLVGAADLDQESARRLAERAGCASFGSADELAVQLRPDAVILATPPASHAPLALELVQRGIHVLCEKPFSIGEAGARQMIAAAEEAGVLITMASKFRYVADVVRARQWAAEGLLGNLSFIDNVFTSVVDMTRRWNSDHRQSGGGVLIDNGTHSVDLLRFFLGPLEELTVFEGRRTAGLPVEETVRLLARGGSGAVARVDLSWSLHQALPWFLAIHGSEGGLTVGWRESLVRHGPNGEWTRFGNGYDKLAAFAAQIDNFAGAVLGVEELVITADDALASVQAIDAAYASMNHLPAGRPSASHPWKGAYSVRPR
jgi:predicted dehydrogenase